MVEDRGWSKGWATVTGGGKGAVSGDDSHRKDPEASIDGILEEQKQVRVTGQDEEDGAAGRAR